MDHEHRFSMVIFPMQGRSQSTAKWQRFRAKLQESRYFTWHCFSGPGILEFGECKKKKQGFLPSK
jgi:hypothetical protein